MMRNLFRGIAGAAVTAAALLATAPSAAAEPALHPSPAGDVTVGQTITISLDGLPPNLPTVAVGQCKPAVVAPTDCNLSGSLLGTADAQGVWQPGQRGRTIVLTASVGSLDCTAAPGACTLAVTSLTDPSHILTSVPLVFGHPDATKSTQAPAAAAKSSSDNGTVYLIVGAVVVVVLVVAGVIVMSYRRRTRQG
ncbi:neocarzinostatin apoprotein domain-containing protein [Nocardia sp. NBC_00511]|uniref:neocarzinostatin apoprotein domain-containing protein n=1 Tax=Nocardia sp. NBC_00511 TaxID=2903591 RepID=UPI0030DE069C